jgi:hypothetical protein
MPGPNWAELIQALTPVIGGVAAGGHGGTPHFMTGYQESQARIAEERRRKDIERQNKLAAGAKFRLDLLQQAQGLDDPVHFAQLTREGGRAYHEAFGGDPSEITGWEFPQSVAQHKRLKILTDKLAQLDKTGDLDAYVQAGGRLDLGDGTPPILIEDAMRATAMRPVDAQGKPMAVPKKPVPPTAGSETERAGQLLEAIDAAEEAGDKVKAAALRKQYANLKRAKQELGTADDRLPTELDTTLKQLRADILARDLANRGGGKVDDPQRAALVQSILANPSILDTLTPSKRTELAPYLAEAGFGFGKPLAESAVGKMAETRSAIKSLTDLREVLQKNEQFIGPVAGLSALNPYSKARQAQADIDRVKQRVGKALEGGVLRKEDEEKYKKILATLRDTPETAIYKIDQIIQSMENDLKIFEDEQRRAGRRVTTPAPAGPANDPLGILR